MPFRRISVGLLTLALVACARPVKPAAPDATARLQAIPAVSSEKYRTMQDMKGWGNPYLIVRADGIALLDSSNHEEHRLKVEELPDALANLPSSAWPYGRVVAVQNADVDASAADSTRIRDNRAKVAAALHSLQIVINYVPSA